ncbi:hypothetical protein ACFZC5_34405 [Nocardia gamkensis]|uniref:hypothetical protein n=1 Tax=Nocardia gamkensis TaxID=352869 RepID=UPI0036E85298
MYPYEFTSGAAQPGRPAPPVWTLHLLEPDHLLQAFTGQLRFDSAVVQWARDLADLHAELIPHRVDSKSMRMRSDCEEVRAQIDRVVDDIDAWAAKNVPRMKGARMHTHSLGEVLSHIAMAFADAWWAVLHVKDAELRHRAWLHLAQAREGYAEMVAEMRAQRLQLPLGSVGVRTGAVVSNVVNNHGYGEMIQLLSGRSE